MEGVANLEDITVADLFALSPENAASVELRLKSDDFKKAEAAAKELARPIAWTQLRPKLASTVASAMQVKVLDGWVAAWQKWKDVKEGAEKSCEDPEAVVPCELMEHTIVSELHPYLEVYAGPTRVQRVDFDVTLTTEIDGVLLNMKGGSLISIWPGRFQWKGSIGLHGAELLSQPLGRLDLPGKVNLKEPIAIRTTDHATAEDGVETRAKANGRK
jgi:hypothetical protein